METTGTETALVFVYGSLRRGQRLAYLLETSEYVKDACLNGGVLYDLGAFPGLVMGPGTANKSPIRGEVYRVGPLTLEHLDIVEGVPYLYQRKLVQLDCGTYAFVYQYYADRLDCFCDDDTEIKPNLRGTVCWVQHYKKKNVNAKGETR